MSDEFTFEDSPASGDAAPSSKASDDTFSFSAPRQPRGVVSSFFQGANEVITALAIYAPENAVMSSLESVGLIKEGSPRKVTDWMNETFGLGGADSPDQVDRLARAAGSMVVQNMATIAPIYAEAKLAELGLKAVQPGINNTLAQAIKNQFVNTIQRAPVLSFAAEGAAATGAGAAMEFTKEEGGGKLAQGAAGLAGGVAPGVGISLASRSLPALAAKGVKAVTNRFGEAGRLTAAQKSVQKEIRAGMDATGEANLKAANEALGRINTARAEAGLPSAGGLTIAESTAAPNLLAQQHKFEKEATGSVLNNYVRRKLQLASNVLLGNAHKPEFTGIEPDVIYDASRARVDKTVGALDSKIGDIKQQQSDVVGNLPRAEDRVDLGTRLRAIRENERGKLTNIFNQRATEIGLNDYGTRFQMESLQDNVRAAMNLKGTTFLEGDLPPSIRDLINLPKTRTDAVRILGSDGKPIGSAPKQTTEPLVWADVELLRRRLTDDLEKAVATPGEGRYVRQLTIAKQLFDEHMLAVSPENASRPTFGADWQSFRNDYFNQVITRFDQGAAYKVSAAGKTSEYRMLGEKVADAFLSSESTVRDFKRLYGDRPDAMIALRDAVMDKVRDASVRNGEVNVGLFNTWVRKNARQLDEIPAIRDELLHTQSRLSALSAREAQLVARKAVVEKMALTKALGRNPEEYVRRAIHDEKLMRYVVNTARRTKTTRALTAAIWEEAYRQVGTKEGELPDPASLIKFLSDNSRTIKMALPREHLQSLTDVADVLTAVRRTPIPKGAASNTRPLADIEQVTGSTPSQVGNRLIGVWGGRLSERQVLLDAGIKFFDKFTSKQKDALMQEALMNESLARDIKDMTISAGKEGVTKAQMRRLNGWLYTLGVASSTSDTNTEQP